MSSQVSLRDSVVFVNLYKSRMRKAIMHMDKMDIFGGRYEAM